MVDTNDFVLPDNLQQDEDIVVFRLKRTIVDVVKYNQDRIRTEIIHRGIPIETCPTSNLRIAILVNTPNCQHALYYVMRSL